MGFSSTLEMITYAIENSIISIDYPQWHTFVNCLIYR